MPGKKFGFETSSSLKQLLAEKFEEWRKKHGGDLSELAERCGVTTAYLSHVRRYGRIPSRPVMILLAMNFGMDGAVLFKAAGVEESYPYEPGLTITQPSSDAQGLFSLKFNMDAFSDTIRGIVRSEIRQRSVKDLLAGRPLRIGVNYNQFWLFDSPSPPTNAKHTGVFPEFCTMLGLALQKDVELVHVPFPNYSEMLRSGQIDLFGPTLVVPNVPGHILFSAPIFRLGISGLYRRRELPGFPTLPVPKKAEDLRDDRYQIAVIRNSLPHLIANTLLKRSDQSLIFVSSDEEGLERLTMRGIARPVHAFLLNSMTAILSAKKYPKDIDLILATRTTLLDLADDSIAIRPDWPEMVPVINDAIRFLLARGGLVERLSKVHSGDMAEVVVLVGA